MGETMKFLILFFVMTALIGGATTGSLTAGIVMGLLVVIIIVCGIKFSAKAEKEEKAKNAPKEFYEECKKQGITDLKDTYQREKAILIAQRAGCNFTNIEQFYDEVSTKMEVRIASQEQAKKNEEFRKLREEEETKKAELKRFAEYQGRSKRVAILEDMQSNYRKRAAELREIAKYTYYSSQEREINSGVAGGFASGLAGGFAGVAAYLDAENENERIRARNKANREAISPFMLHLSDNELDCERKAKELQTAIDDAKIKLVSQMPDHKVFEYLSVSSQKVEISKTGAFDITAEVRVNAKKQDLMIGKAAGVIDGAIVAEMYQSGKKIGSALMVLPTFGVKDTATVMGISTCHADAAEPYDIKFRPYHLWIMEE